MLIVSTCFLYVWFALKPQLFLVLTITSLCDFPACKPLGVRLFLFRVPRACRWLYKHRDIFQDRTLLELGSGVGLPGILCARYAKRVYLTDYLDSVRNLVRCVVLREGS